MRHDPFMSWGEFEYFETNDVYINNFQLAGIPTRAVYDTKEATYVLNIIGEMYIVCSLPNNKLLTKNFRFNKFAAV